MTEMTVCLFELIYKQSLLFQKTSGFIRGFRILKGLLNLAF